MSGGPTSGTATVLFTDLVGSTEVMSRLGDVAFDGLRTEHFARLRHAVAAHGGVEVKNTGDGILATFSSVVEALAAAVGMQQAAHQQAVSAAAPVTIRVGISLGEVTLDAGDVYGTPVVEAARLVAAARPGQILATAVVRMVAGNRAPTPFSEAGTIDLKGLPDPVPVCEVTWEPKAGVSIALPVLLTGAGRVFVGRDGDLERLGQLWKEAAAGERRVALVGGEPGVGKTRLAAELARRVHGEGGVVLGGRCDEDLGVPFQPFVEALRHYLAHAEQPELGRLGGELARLAPEVVTLVSGLPEPLRSDPETERYRLFDAVTGWLGRVAAESPVLLVLDDLQWAAKPTLLLLRHVLRAEEPMRLLVLATYRDTELSRTHPLAELLADLRRQGGVERVSLQGLDVPGVAAFLEAAAGHELGDEAVALARAIHAETEGNPFFVVEVVRHLIETGGFVQRDGRWTAAGAVEELGIPEGVREVIGRRLSRLSEVANRVLAVAAVAGLQFEPGVVHAVAGLDEEEVISALEEAVGARLVVDEPGGRCRFSHALVRATLYDELTAARRVALHRKVGQAIEALHAGHLGNHLPALAHHYARAAAPAADVAKAVEYATQAGDSALAQLAHDEAATYYRSALDLLDSGESGPAADADRRLELLIALGEAQRRAGNAAHRETLLDAARLAEERGDAEALARAALANMRGVYFSSARGTDTERVGALETALRILPAGDSVLRARLLAALGLELFFDPDRPRRLALGDSALAMARRLGDTATLVHVLSARPFTIAAPDTLDERLAVTAELIAIAEQLGDPVLECRAWAARFRTAFDKPDIEEVDRALANFQRLAAEVGQPALRWTAGLSQVGRHILAGHLREAEEQALATYDLGTAAGQPDARIFFMCHRFWVSF
ncbi:MAG: ATP-binding protein, partial [Acidimicrobiia bacterium]